MQKGRAVVERADADTKTLSETFDAVRRTVTGESLEDLRHNYFVAAKMRGDDDLSIGGLNINQSGRKDDATLAKEKTKRATDDFLLMALIDESLAALEADLVSRYGEDFAENWAAELLDKDLYAELMQIEDQAERRRAIAIAIQQGLDNGSITRADLNRIPDIQDWLSAHDHEEKLRLSAESPDAGSGDNNHKLTPATNEETAFDTIFSNNSPVTR